MILSDLKGYLKERRRVALADLASRFDVEPEALRDMMQLWVNKGRVRRLEGGIACVTCSSCTDAQLEVYEWVD